MKTTSKVIIALAILVPAAACGKSESVDNAAETDVATTDKSATSDDFHVYSVGGLRLDCPQGIEALKADAIAAEGMELVTETDEQVAYMAGPVSYTFTKDGHFAHPMIIRRDVIVSEPEKLSVSMAACGYGEKEASDKTMERFALLNERFLLQQKIRVKSDIGSSFEVTGEGEDGAPETENQE